MGMAKKAPSPYFLEGLCSPHSSPTPLARLPAEVVRALHLPSRSPSLKEQIWSI